MALFQSLNQTAITVVLLGILVCRVPIVYLWGGVRPEKGDKKFWLKSAPWDVIFAALLLIIPLAFAFFCSLMPPTQSDGLRYHLSVPKLYLNHGGFYPIPDIAFSNFPFLIEYLYAIPLAFGSDSVPKMIHASFFLLTIFLIYDVSKKMGGARSGMYGALLFASIPFASIFASWSFIEMGLTLYMLLTLALCIEAMEDEEKGGGAAPLRSMIVCGVSGGFLLSCKYTALAPLFLFFLMLAWPGFSFSWGKVRYTLKRAILFGIIVFSVASPWFIKNIILWGNPVYPFAGSIFPTPHWSCFNDLFFRFHAGLKGHYNELLSSPVWMWIQDAVTLPFRVTFYPGDKIWHPDDFGSWQLGPLWLTLTPLLLLYRSWTPRKFMHLIAGLFLYVVWAYTYRDSRFLLPCMAVMAPLFAVVVEEIVLYRPWTKWCFFTPIFYGLLFTSSVILLPTKNAPWWVVSGTISEDDYLEHVCDFTRNPNQAFRWLKENTRPDEKVLLHGIEHPFYCPNDFAGADWFNTDPLIAWSWESPSVEGLLERLKKEKIRYLVYYYGKIKNPGHFQFYRLFRLPPEKGYALLQEFKEKQYSRIYY
ncbi:MAG: ArnT family glycosyltransferase, partial [Candidatus Hinthialibacter sp.]